MKKGQTDIIIIPVLLFILIVTIVAGVIALRAFMNEVEYEMPVIYNLTDQDVENTINVMDLIAPIVMIGFGLALIVTSFFVYSHPIMYIVGIASITIGVITSAGISNALMELNATSNAYTGAALTVTMGMSPYIPHILFGIAIIGAIALYSKTGGATGGV